MAYFGFGLYFHLVVFIGGLIYVLRGEGIIRKNANNSINLTRDKGFLVLALVLPHAGYANRYP
jgi:hypothetical protein